MSNPNAAVRHFMGGINAAAYWIGDHLLRGADIVNDSGVTGATVKAALNTLSTASTAVFPFAASGLAEQDLISYDASTSTWRNRTKVNALKGTGALSFVVGTNSLAAGTNDIILGTSAGTATNTGSDNIGIGTDTLDDATVALQNVIAIGGSALSGALTAAANGSVALGAAALLVATSGRNTAVGYQSGIALADGTRNTLLGYRTASAASANDNVFIGDSVGNANVGSQNVAIGSFAFNSIAAGNAITDCIAIGVSALTGPLTIAASGSIGIGTSALALLTSGNANTAIGYASQQATTTGTANTTVGYNTMGSASIGVTVSNCTGVGYSALSAALTVAASGATAVGRSALAGLTSGAATTAIGYQSGLSITIGSRNTLFGYSTDSASGANDNTFIGNSVGNSSVGSQNTAVGSLAFNSASVAVTDCVAIGYNALTLAVTSAANGAVAVGSQALTALTSGAGNTAVGWKAGDGLTTGSSMTIVGYDADGDAVGRSGCCVIGRGATATADDTLVIRMGNTSTKELVVTPVVTATPVATISNLPLTVGGTSYTIPLGPASAAYASSLTTDQIIAVNATVVDTNMTVSVPAGTYAFSYAGFLTRSTANGGAITIRCSTAATITYSSTSHINASSGIVYLNDSLSVLAGNSGDVIYDTNSTAKQYEQSRGTITCAAPCVFTVAGYCGAAQNMTFHKGSSFSLVRTN